MSVFPGQVVMLNSERVSVAGGTSRTFAEGLVGRVCRVSPTGSGFCCVQFPGRCLKVQEDFLTPTNDAAPACTLACNSGC